MNENEGNAKATSFTIHPVSAVTPELLLAFARLMPQLTSASLPTREALQALIDSPSRLIIARCPGGSGPVVGAACLGIFRTPSGLHAHIEDVIVDEALRGQGIGAALILALLEVARRSGLQGVSLTCNPRREAANALYRKMGFKEWKTNLYWYDL